MIRLILIAVLLASCASAPPVSRQAAQIHMAHNPPPGPAQFLGPLSVAHGQGCGGFGERGNLQGAMSLLHNAAADAGADYVQITRIAPDGHTAAGFGCYRNAYTLEGNAYRLGTAQAMH